MSIRLIEEEIKSGKIHVIKNVDSDWDRVFSIVHHKNKIESDEMAYLIEEVKNYKHIDILKSINIGNLVK